LVIDFYFKQQLLISAGQRGYGLLEHALNRQPICGHALAQTEEELEEQDAEGPDVRLGVGELDVLLRVVGGTLLAELVGVGELEQEALGRQSGDVDEREVDAEAALAHEEEAVVAQLYVA
jgi:hypothetical protein